MNNLLDKLLVYFWRALVDNVFGNLWGNFGRPLLDILLEQLLETALGQLVDIVGQLLDMFWTTLGDRSWTSFFFVRQFIEAAGRITAAP